MAAPFFIDMTGFDDVADSAQDPSGRRSDGLLPVLVWPG